VNPDEFKRRTKGLGLAVIKLVDSLPRRGSVQTIGTQLPRAATSVGANYRAACRGRPAADVIAKLSVVLEEVDETAYWLELLLESGHASADSIDDLLTEAHEITAMTVALLKTLKARYPRP
jgi:four helix bundle protein